MGIFDKLFRKKSFDELLDEYYKVGWDRALLKKGYENLFKRRLEILKQAAKRARNDKERLVVNAYMLELKREAQAHGIETR